jgi:hypothetical protein
MIQVEDFSKMISGEHEILLQQTAGLSHADSLLQPEPGGNCLNWVMGHLVGNLVEILKVLGEVPPSGLPDLQHYGYGSEPILRDEPGVHPFEDLIESYTRLNNLVIEKLKQMTEADFEEEIDFFQEKTRRGYIAFFYFFHNTYHLGQLEQFRNLAGKTEKVI